MWTRVLCIVVGYLACVACGKGPTKLLLISFDGFRYNYLKRTNTPNFDKLIHEGVKAKWIKDVFISQTFPNHYAIATGLYEESHGIVANRFYDPVLNKSFDYRSPSDVGNPIFWGGEPIWVTAEKQGIKTGVFYWVGSEAPIKGIRPTEWRNYSVQVNWTSRVDTVVDWLANKGPDPKNITLTLLYFPQPDHYGHIYGPESSQVTKMIAKCDAITGYLMRKLEDNGILEEVNIIITSDHGMTELKQARTVAILPHINQNHLLEYINYGTGAAIWPRKGYTEQMYQQLVNISSHVDVWKKENIPEVFHYRQSQRIPPILLMSQDQWFLVDDNSSKINMNGSHGYNNSQMDMHPFFIAHGPAFRQNYISKPFSSVDIYGLICHILQLKPAPNNGSFEAVKQLLAITESVHPSPKYRGAEIIGVVVGALLAILVVIFVIKQFSQARGRKYSSSLLSSDSEREEPLLDERITSEPPTQC